MAHRSDDFQGKGYKVVKDKEVEKIILDIMNRIKKTYHPEKIILFGSYAYGEPNKSSDIDMLIIKDTPERPIDRRIKVRHLVNIKEPVAFSPVVLTPDEVRYLNDIGDHFIIEILNKGIVLLG